MTNPFARPAPSGRRDRPLSPPDPVPGGPELGALRRGLRRQRARLWLRRAVRRAWWALAIVLLAEVVLLAVARVAPVEIAPALAVVIALVAVGGLAVSVALARPSLGETALALDAEAGLADRLASALAFAAETGGAAAMVGPLAETGAHRPDAMAQAAFVERQREDAVRVLATVPAATFRPGIAHRAALLAAVAALLVLPLVLIPNGMDERIAQDRAVRDESAQTAERIDKLAEELERRGRTPEDPRSRLARELRNLAAGLKGDPGALDTNLARLGGVEASVREQLDPANEERAAALAALSRGLSRAVTGDAKANAGGDPERAAADLARAADGLADRSAQELGRLGQSLAALQGAASQAGGTADGALRDATNALARGDGEAAADALRRLNDALQDAQDRVTTSRDLSGAAAQLQDARRRLADAGRPGSSTAANPGQQGQGQGQPTASGSQGHGQGQGQSSGQGSGSGSGQGSGQGQGSGSGQGQGSIGGGGSNARYLGSGTGAGAPRGPANPNRPAGEPADQGSVYAPFDRLGRPGDPTYVAGTGGDGGQVQPGSGTGTGATNPAIVPYADVFADFYRYAQVSLDRSYVPIAVKDLVRDYFSALDPTGQETK